MFDMSSAGTVNALCGTLLTLSVVTTGLRFYTRTVQKLPLGIDDWAMVPCMERIAHSKHKLFYLGACIVVFLGVKDKLFGYPTSSFTKAQVMSMAKISAQMEIAWDILSTCALACIKISAVYFYRRIFCVFGRKATFSIITEATAVVTFLWLVTFLFLTGFQCGTHFSALWDGTYLQYCTFSYPIPYSFVISDLLIDVWILALPVPQIMKLRTNKQRKFSIFGVFLLAFIGLGASIARMAIYIQYERASRGAVNGEATITGAIYLSMLEAGMSLIAVNLPSLWFLFSKGVLETSLHSVRSFLLLRSSVSINQASRTGPTGVVKDSFSTSSRSNLARNANDDACESFAMHDQGLFDVEKDAGTKTQVGELLRQREEYRE